jgi:two-component system, response regulator YesN
MYNILVVDDEVEIADYLHQLVKGLETFEVDAYKAYSGDEALTLLGRNRMDIVLSDMKMPGLSGLDLLERINERWPHCLVIFLTGYQDFDSIYTATKMGSVQYLLKTLEDHEILDALEITIARLEKERRTVRCIQKSEPYLIHQLLEDGLLSRDENFWNRRSTIELLEELGIELDVNESVYIVLAKFDFPVRSSGITECKNILQAAEMLNDHLVSNFVHVFTSFREQYLVSLLQPRDKTLNDPQSLIWGNLDLIQTLFHDQVKQEFSFLLESCPVPLSRLAKVFDEMTDNLDKQIGAGNRGGGRSSVAFDGTDLSFRSGLHFERGLQLLHEHLESGRKEEFNNLIDAIFSSSGDLYEAYISISLILYRTINTFGLYEEINNQTGLLHLFNLEEHLTRDAAVKYLKTVSHILFDKIELASKQRVSAIIESLCGHIRNHLSEDISLVRLADFANLNASYLSRLFKKEIGQNLSVYIANEKMIKARDLLSNPRLKIKEVAAEVGYYNPAYFTRFFKQLTGLSPAEYRNSMANVKNREDM